MAAWTPEISGARYNNRGKTVDGIEGCESSRPRADKEDFSGDSLVTMTTWRILSSEEWKAAIKKNINKYIFL